MTLIPDKRRVLATAPLLAAAAFLLVPLFTAFAGEVAPLKAALLTKELGDPRNPGNAKLVLGLPPAYSAPHIPVRARDFRVYVYPANLTPEQGKEERYRAGGVYLWRSGSKVFLDARVLPHQDEEGPARVRVVFAPEGTDTAEGEAEGNSRYSSDLVDVVLAVDVSLSMKYNDANKRRVAAARTFIEMARKGGGIGRVGLVTFNNRASLGSGLIPLSEGEKLLTILNSVGAEGTTNLDAPLDMALEELRGSRNPVVILLSDGKNEGHVYEDSHQDAAREGVRVFSVGLSEQADHDLLREMADATDGIYFRAVTDDDLPEIYARLAAELGKRQLLQARRLDARSGSVSYPIDATVERLVGMVDGGARLGAKGPEAGRSLDRALSSVYMGSPAQGEWEFTWENASPGVSVIALFGDTPFFLDVFPPQLRSGKFSVGATLAHGARALTGGQVWVEPLPGVLPKRLQLFDDGRHNDGEANDGVYGALFDMPGAPDQFDLVLRAAGRAWDKGDFVRQAAGMVIRSTELPVGHANIGGDIDFGVLFPGETGAAIAHIDLDAPSPRELLLDLAWSNGTSDWPDFSSSVEMEPGARDFELEITVPETARPGEYRGGFRVSDGGDLGDTAEAAVRVGTVRFGEAGEMDMGVIPPGTFKSGVLRIPVDADKAAALRASTRGGDDVRVAGVPDRVEAGRSEITVEVIVSAPMGQPEGVYRGSVILEAGPGRVKIPLVWRVVPYSARAEELAPIPGLPQPPELSRNDEPLPATPSALPGVADIVAPDRVAAEPVESPWDRTSQVLRDLPELPGETAPARPSFDFTVPDTAPGGSSFWSAWWLYILAALLLLLLLLLLLAYILYRLGKSALARFLLVSALANLLLLAIFVLLLSAADSVAPRTVPAVAVNLVENTEPIRTVELTAAEKELIASAGSDGAAAGGGSGSGLGEITFADAPSSSASSGGELVSEKTSNLPDGMEEGLSLADARASQPAVSMQSDRSESSMQRRERRQERSRDEVPELELPEMEEPPPELSANPGAATEVGEAELQLQASVEADRPVWSDGVRPVQPLASDQGLLQTEAAGMEKVTMDPTVARVDPRGRRRNTRESSDAAPEPRVQIDDPIRDELAETVAAGEADSGDPGVEEVRVGAVAAGMDIFGEKPGAAVAPGLSRLIDSIPDPMPRGVSGPDVAERAAPRGGQRSLRGGAERAGASQPSTRVDVPGGGGSGNGGGAAITGAAGRNNGQGGRVGERRFDEGGGTESGGGGVDGQDLLDGLGGPRLADAGRGGGASPSPFGGGSGDRAEFQPKNGNGGGSGMNRDGSRRGERGGNGDGPLPGDGLPGSLAGTGDGGDDTGRDNPGGGDGGSRTGNGTNGGRGRGGQGLGEGRFDDMAGADGTGGNGFRSGQGVTGNGASNLAGNGDEPQLAIVSLPTDESGWTMRDRRNRRRQAAVASSSVDMDSLLIVVGDFARLPDAAAENLFTSLAEIMPSGLTVEERRLAPGDANLSDTLLALVSPEEMREWSGEALAGVAGYLGRGGHLWLDAASPDRADGPMQKLAAASGGEFGPLPPDHQLAEDGNVDALFIGDRLAAIVTYQDWRKNWRYGGRNGGTLDFLRRSLNYFLSGNADQGIVLETAPATGGRLVEPNREIMPDLLAGGVGGDGEVWDEFGPETAASWRMPSWSDQGRIAAVSDGQGGRALRIDLGASVKGRAAAYRTLTPPQDFSAVDYVSLDAYYDGDGDASVSMVFTVERPEGWQDYETTTLPLVKGWNRIRFNLNDRTFRALSAGAGGGTALPGRERTGRAGFFLYRDAAGPGVALFRDIRLHAR